VASGHGGAHNQHNCVINLGSEDNSDKLAADEGLQASTTNELDNDMEKKHLLMITIPMFTRTIPFVICSKGRQFR
jgi:hypothetical protein